jgi:DNA-binding transcriptional LysR family regulator
MHVTIRANTYEDKWLYARRIVDFRHLRYFIAVAEEGSFVQAAERLHISQPPLSTQIKDLETELEVRLFERTTRGVVLTTAGAAFYAEARAVLARLEHARIAAQRADRGEQGTLEVGFISIADYNVLPAALKLFRASHSGVDVQLHELTTDAQMRELAQERLDVGIALGPIDDEEIHFVPLLKERLILAVPSEHPLGHAGKPVALSEMSAERFVMVPRALAPGLHDLTIAYCQASGFVPQIHQYAKQMQTIISLVSSEFGFALVPESLRHLQRTGVRYLPLREQSPFVETGAIYGRRCTNPAVPRFIEALQAAAASHRSQLGATPVAGRGSRKKGGA